MYIRNQSIYFHPTSLAVEAKEFSYVSPEARKEAEKKGAALPGGRYPIRNPGDLKAAVRAYGRGNPSDKGKIKAHIIKRARALGKADLIPESWKSTTASANPLPVLNRITANTAQQVDPHTQFAAFSTKERKALAEKGIALEDGSFPIKTKADLSNAIHAFGRAKNKAKAKKHIIKRARALGAVKSLPPNWGVTAAAQTNDALDGLIAAIDDYNRDSDPREHVSQTKALAIYRRGIQNAPLAASADLQHNVGLDRLLGFLDVLQSKETPESFPDSDLLPTWHPAADSWKDPNLDPVVAAVAQARSEIDATWGIHVGI